ncbi:MAG: formate/nitrite transporter family protein [Rhodovibrionaceae bacterium]
MAKTERPDKEGKRLNETEEFSKDDVEEVEEHIWLPAPLVYQIIREEGERELSRPAVALWWSGLAAGMCIGLSLYGKALLHTHLPDAEWRPLVENFGYCIGFLVVILSRHQLFTENTITPILPLMVRRTWYCLYCVIRMWLLVAGANLVGALLFALFWNYSQIADAELLEAMREIGRESMQNSLLPMFTKAIAAGFLMAALVWIMPTAKGAEFWVIVVISYLIAVAELTHIVSGGVGVLLLVLAGETLIPGFFLDFGIPVFIGNVIGGAGLFSVLVYAQVRQEIRSAAEED